MYKIPKLYSLLSYMILFSFSSHCLLIYDFFLFCEQICNRNFYIFVWVLIRPLFPPSFLLSHFAFFGMGTQFSRHIRVTCGCSLVSFFFCVNLNTRIRSWRVFVQLLLIRYAVEYKTFFGKVQQYVYRQFILNIVYTLFYFYSIYFIYNYFMKRKR